MKRKYLIPIFLVIIIFLVVVFRNLNSSLDQIDPKALGFTNFPKVPSSYISVDLNLDFRFRGNDKENEVNLNKEFQSKKPVYFSIINNSNKPVEPHIVVNGKDWISNKEILGTIFNEKIPKSPEDKAIKIMDYVNSNIAKGYPPYEQWNNVNDPFLLFNLFGYGFCKDQATATVLLAKEAGMLSREVSLDCHAVSEIYYNNSWHMFDADGGCYYRNKKGEIVSTEEVLSDPSIIDGSKCPDEISSFHRKQKLFYFGSEEILGQNLNLNKISFNDFLLNPKDEIRFYYNWPYEFFSSYYNLIPKETSCGPSYPNIPPPHTNGLLISKISSKDKMSQTIKLPYPILDSVLQAKNLCQFADKISVLVGESKQSINAGKYCLNDTIKLKKLFPRGNNSNITLQYLLKFANLAPKENLLVYTVFQVAPNSIPKLKNGINFVEDKNLNNNTKVVFAFN